MRTRLLPLAVLGVLALVTVILVAGSLRRPDVPVYEATASAPREVGDSLVGPRIYTVDASDPDRWVFFDFSRGAVVADPGPLDWDLGFNRFSVIANGGAGFAGEGGVVDLGELPFDSVTVAPAGGYQATEAGRDSVNAAFRHWYDYSFTSHILTSGRRVYAVRTADGRHARLRFLSYYCPGPRAGCVTFEYVYQGKGGRDLTPTPASPPAGGP